MDAHAPVPLKVVGLPQPAPSSLPAGSAPFRFHRASDSPNLDPELLRVAETALNIATPLTKPSAAALQEFTVRISHDDTFIAFASHFHFMQTDIEKIAILDLFKSQKSTTQTARLADALEYQSRYKYVVAPNLNIMRFYHSLHYFNSLAAESYAIAMKTAPNLDPEIVFRKTAHSFGVVNTEKKLPDSLSCIEYFNSSPLMADLMAFQVEGFVGIRRAHDAGTPNRDYALGVLPALDFSRFVLYAYLDPRSTVLQMLRKHGGQRSHCTPLINTYMAYHDADEEVLTREIRATIRGKPAFVSKRVFIIETKPSAPQSEQASAVLERQVKRVGKTAAKSDTAPSLAQPMAVIPLTETESPSSPAPEVDARPAAQRSRIRMAGMTLLGVLLVAAIAVPVATTRYGVTLAWPLRHAPQQPATPALGVAEMPASTSTEPARVMLAAVPGHEEAKALEAPTTTPVPVPPVASSLTLAARGDVWVQIAQQQTGQIILMRLLRAGDTRIVPMQPGLVLTVGAAQNLSISMDGRDIRLDAFLQRGSIRGVRIDEILRPTRSPSTM